MMQNADTEVKEKEILSQASDLIDQVKSAFTEQMPIHKLEYQLFDSLLKIGHQLLSLLFSLCGQGDVGETCQLSAEDVVKRLPDLSRRQYLSIFGEFNIERFVYGTRKGQKIQHIPLDAHLQLPINKFSYLLQDWGQSLAVEGTYRESSETLKKIFNVTFPVSGLERCNASLSASVDEFWAEEVQAPKAQEKQLVVCSADCKGVVIRKSKEDKASDAANAADAKPSILNTTQSKKHSGKKKMAVVGSAYTIDPNVRTPEQVLESLFRKPGQEKTQDQTTPRPRPIAKTARVSMERDDKDTLTPARANIFNWLSEEQKQRKCNDDQVFIAIMDGEPALWSQAQESLVPSSIEILDIIHVSSYVWKSVQAIHHEKSQEEQVQITRRYMSKILNSKTWYVIRSFKNMATRKELDGKKLEEVQKACVYLENNQSRMDYHRYLANGYPIASGVIEGACRHIIVDRMERSGMRWVMNGAQSMLDLRCVHISDYWSDYIEYHIEKERNRLYPHQAANDALLGNEIAIAA